MQVVEERVLLLEDDAAFQEVIRDFLKESGYAVVTARSGVEGLREVMNGDFAAILCDMLMPTLPGDMFYRAVERIRPELCERFVFMTGHLGDHNTNAFIREVDREVLFKPFRMRALMQTLNVLKESRVAAAQHVLPTPVATLAVPPRDSGAAPAAVPSAAPRGREDFPRQPARVAEAVSQPAVKQQAPAMARSHAGAYASAVLALAFLALLVWTWRLAIEQSSATKADLSAIENEWTALSARVHDAEKTRPGIEERLALPKRIVEWRDAPRWTSALRWIATSAPPEIELQLITARSVTATPGASKLSIQGLSVGESRIDAANRFRQALKTGLDQEFGGIAMVRLSELDDEPATASAVPDQQRASFFISATFGRSAPAKTSDQER